MRIASHATPDVTSSFGPTAETGWKAWENATLEDKINVTDKPPNGKVDTPNRGVGIGFILFAITAAKHELHIEAPVPKIWSLLTEIDRRPEWNLAVRSAN